MKRFQKSHLKAVQAAGRRGVITPLAALVLLVVLAGVALVVNRLWLDAASLEVTTCIETAVLAAGQELASDELLKEKPDYKPMIERAVKAANKAIVLNTVAGQRIGIPLTKDKNLFFGKSIPVAETGMKKFLQTDHQPLSIQLKTQQSSQRNNPVVDLMSDVSGSNLGIIGSQIEASIDNHIIGVRPFDNVSIPAFPLAILKCDPSGKHTETWELQIDQKKGKDEYRYDPDTKKVTRGSDGILEIKLTGKPRRGKISDSNLQLLDFGSRHNSESVERQILTGLTKQDLKHYQGALFFNADPISIKCSPVIEDNEQKAFQKMIGQCRICFLYDKVVPTSRSYKGYADCTNMVAGRIMSVKRLGNQACEIILQPGVMTTRTGILAAVNLPDSETDSKNEKENDQQRKNKYIYKLFLTQ